MTVMESMAIRDGLYDPYAETFGLGSDASTDDFTSEDTGEAMPATTDYGDANDDVKVDLSYEAESESTHRYTMTVYDIEQAIQDRIDVAFLFDDFNTIREMLDSGVISEFDVDDDVLAKVEDYM